MQIRLNSDERGLLLNFCSQSMSEVTSMKEIEGLAVKFGLRM